MFNYFEKKKDTLFDYKKQNFSKSKKSHICQRGYSMLLARKCHFFSFFRFDQNKTRNKTSEFAMKKETFFDLENRKSQKNRKVQKIAFFSKRFNLGFRSKNAKSVFV